MTQAARLIGFRPSISYHLPPLSGKARLYP